MSAPETAAGAILRDLARVSDPFFALSADDMRRHLVTIQGALKSAVDSTEIGALYSAKGQFLFHLGDIDGSAAAFRNAVRHASHVAVHSSNLACSYMAQRDYAKAFEAIRNAQAHAKEASADNRAVIALNHAELLCRSGDAVAGAAAFVQARKIVDWTSGDQVFHVAAAAAEMGLVHDAVEYLARAIAAVSHDELGDTPAFEFVAAHAALATAAAARSRALADAIRRANEQHDSSIPATDAHVELTEEAFDALNDLIEHPPAPPDALRRLLHDADA